MIAGPRKAEGYLPGRPLQRLDRNQALLDAHSLRCGTPLSGQQMLQVSPRHGRAKGARTSLDGQGGHTDSTETLTWTPEQLCQSPGCVPGPWQHCRTPLRCPFRGNPTTNSPRPPPPPVLFPWLMECTLKTNALCLVTSRRVHSVPSGLVTFEFLNSLKQRKYFSLRLVLLLASPGPRAAVSR